MSAIIRWMHKFSVEFNIREQLDWLKGRPERHSYGFPEAWMHWQRFLFFPFFDYIIGTLLSLCA